MGRDGYKDGQTATESVVVDDVKQYKISLSYFSATLKVTSDSGATVTATNGTKTFSGTVPTSGVLSPDDYRVRYLYRYRYKERRDDRPRERGNHDLRADLLRRVSVLRQRAL